MRRYSLIAALFAVLLAVGPARGQLSGNGGGAGGGGTLAGDTAGPAGSNTTNTVKGGKTPVDTTQGINAMAAASAAYSMGGNKLQSLAAGTASGDAMVFGLSHLNDLAVATADYPMGSHKLTGLGTNTATGDALSQAQSHVNDLAAATAAYSMGGNKLQSLAAGTVSGDALSFGLSHLNDMAAATGNYAMGTNKITGLAVNTGSGDALSQAQSHLNDLATATAAYSMGSNKLQSLAVGTTSGDALVFALSHLNDMATATNDYAMGGHKLTGLAAPVSTGDACSNGNLCSPSALGDTVAGGTNGTLGASNGGRFSVNGNITIGSPQYPVAGSLLTSTVVCSGASAICTTANTQDFVANQYVVAPRAGPTTSLTAPAGLALAFTSVPTVPFGSYVDQAGGCITGNWNANCTTVWNASVIAVDANNGRSAAATTVTSGGTGPATASTENGISLSWTTTANARAYIIELSTGANALAMRNVVEAEAGGTQKFRYEGNNYFADDTGSTAYPGAAVKQDFLGQISSVVANTSITFGATPAAGTWHLYHDDGPSGFTAAFNAKAATGGEIDVPPGNYTLAGVLESNTNVIEGVTLKCPGTTKFGGFAPAKIYYVGGVGGRMLDFEWSVGITIDGCKMIDLGSGGSTPSVVVNADNTGTEPTGAVYGKNTVVKNFDIQMFNTGFGTAISLYSLSAANGDSDIISHGSFAGQGQAAVYVGGNGQTNNIWIDNNLIGGGVATDAGILTNTAGGLLVLNNAFTSQHYMEKNVAPMQSGAGGYTSMGNTGQGIGYYWYDIAGDAPGGPVKFYSVNNQVDALITPFPLDNGHILNSLTGGFISEGDAFCVAGGSNDCALGIGCASVVGNNNKTVITGAGFNKAVNASFPLLPGYTAANMPPITTWCADNVFSTVYLPSIKLAGNSITTTPIPDIDWNGQTQILPTSGSGSVVITPPASMISNAPPPFIAQLAAYHETGAAKTYTFVPASFSTGALSLAPIIQTVSGSCAGLSATSTVLTLPSSGTVTGVCSIEKGLTETLPAVGSCGTGAAVTANSTRISGSVTIGSTNPTATCPITFATACANALNCGLGDAGTFQPLKPVQTSASVLTITAQTDMHGDKVYWQCGCN